jgi:hypothetical protein
MGKYSSSHWRERHGRNMSWGLVAVCPSFWLFFLFLYILTIQYIHPAPFAEVLFNLLIACVLSGKNFPKFEFGPASQQADALPADLRLTLTELRLTRNMYCTSNSFLLCWREEQIPCTAKPQAWRGLGCRWIGLGSKKIGFSNLRQSCSCVLLIVFLWC